VLYLEQLRKKSQVLFPFDFAHTRNSRRRTGEAKTFLRTRKEHKERVEEIPRWYCLCLTLR
jgi:hypothetical protein